MLLVCNGAQKSGSTWLYNILTSLKRCKIPDQKYLTNNSRHPCIKPELLGQFLESENYGFVDYITKNHLANRKDRDLLLSNDDVYVFNIEREPKDVIVSLYFDECNRHGYDKPFKSFYWSTGREEAVKLSLYHSMWREPGSRSHVANYQGLMSDFSAEVRAIAGVLGINLTDDAVKKIQDETSIDKLRQKYSDQEFYKGKKFFRKGVVGDWRNHFDERMLEDVERIMNYGFGALDWRHAVYRCRRWLKWQLDK